MDLNGINTLLSECRRRLPELNAEEKAEMEKTINNLEQKKKALIEKMHEQ